MIERRPLLTFTRHALLILGIAIVAFPLYVTFVASTLTLEQILAISPDDPEAATSCWDTARPRARAPPSGR